MIAAELSSRMLAEALAASSAVMLGKRDAAVDVASTP
ncbi:hypothetical protein BH24ACT13_BH24ACT13_16500 [soil metagenome]|jgi:hypothetical protein